MNPLPPEMSPTTSSSIKSNSRTLGSGSSLSNKENLTAIDTMSGICNLSVERQKMKKSRKASGYNLRKSIAWNKAFFTEEGVLDPVELSMISGIGLADSLSVEDEERRDSLIVTSDVDRSSAKETRKENFDKELLSGRPNKINKSSSLLKQDSSPDNRLPVLSRSSQKVTIGRGLNKSASKVASRATPRTPTQKRLLTGTPKVMTRSSKIPRVPLSKHPPLPFTTSIQAVSDGSQLKCAETPQPAAQKRVGLKLPSTIKPAAKDANIRSGGTYKSSSGANGLNTTCLSLEMGSTTIHKAQNTNKVNNYLQNNSKQNISTTKVNNYLPNNSKQNISTIDETINTKISSQHQFHNEDGVKKDFQAQGIKPSGLRMPSPSMRFFSEGNMKSSNHKVTIPTSKNSKAVDHISEFKQIKDRHGSLCHDATSKKRLSSQVTEIGSASSLVDPTVHVDTMYGKCRQQKVQPGVLPGDKLPKPINNVQCTKNILNDVYNQHSNNHDAMPKKGLSSQATEMCVASSLVDSTAHADTMNEKSHQQRVQPRVLLGDKVAQPINNVKYTKNSLNNIDNQHSNEILSSLKDEGQDAKCHVILSHTEPANINCSNPVFQPIGHSCGNMMNNSIASCPELQLTVDSTSNGEASSTLDEETCCSSSTMNDKDLLESVTVLNSHHNNYTLAADCDPSTSMLYEDKTPGEKKIDDSEQPYVKGSLKLQLGEKKLLADDNYPLEMDESGLAEPACVGGLVDVEISEGEKLSTITDTDVTINNLPSNAVPFSDEWLAAMESAGEEILSKKTGAVQHSPPDKSVPEPSPWSPVKRKNNQMIGPFDCTKCTNTQPDQSQQA